MKLCDPFASSKLQSVSSAPPHIIFGFPVSDAKSTLVCACVETQRPRFSLQIYHFLSLFFFSPPFNSLFLTQQRSPCRVVNLSFRNMCVCFSYWISPIYFVHYDLYFFHVINLKVARVFGIH